MHFHLLGCLICDGLFMYDLGIEVVDSCLILSTVMIVSIAALDFNEALYSFLSYRHKAIMDCFVFVSYPVFLSLLFRQLISVYDVL